MKPITLTRRGSQQCRKQPKALNKTTGKPYDFCSTQCRDKQNSLLEKEIAGTCKMCLICLQGDVPDADKPYCGPECLAATLSIAPALVEIPRGHLMFEKCTYVSNRFSLPTSLS